MSALNVVHDDFGSKDNAPTGNTNDPTIVKLKVAWTKDQLKDASDFQYYKPPARTAATPLPGTNGSAPRPTAPATPRPQTQYHWLRRVHFNDLGAAAVRPPAAALAGTSNDSPERAPRVRPVMVIRSYV